ncbi:lysM domain receptor-like kinase 4 [Ricinus communis]|uniref:BRASSINOSTEROID INSENSITIVE 1-associated receptor kinase 1, putative n=1 Tax=Ricinus communis TaxID=3988 RepID=B9T4V9_RICCO|nr:lysM domain receptor-like kinase 4 [Ricinus communis]EEF29110.1 BRASSINOSTEROID INSENSITIVE 1-associated receptor kinase 1 precursor, putative [Ricinus communis]|eukprot:XP_002533278.1 lysM domain receptor-like kinase 4 [Ricinus communis]
MGFISAFSLFFLSIFLAFCCLLIHAQQPYVAKATTNCTNTADSALGYSCNGLNTSCQTYLTFRSQPPYTNVTSISTLLNSDPSQLSAINSVSETATFDTNKLVIVPVNCSCSGDYYQANTSYVVQAKDAPFFIANNTFQGLSTCQAINDQNRRQTVDIFPNEILHIPLRCACPTKNQTDAGIKYLLSYLVTWGDTVSAVSVKFGGNTGRSLEANGLSEQTPTIYPFTTLLIPLENPPTSNQTISPPPPPASSPPPPPSTDTPNNGSSSKKWVYVLVGVLAGIVFTLGLVTIIFYALFRRSKRKPEPIIVSESFEAQEKSLNKKLDEESQDFLDSISSIAQSIKVYKFKELEAATDNFSPSCWIKGSVYRGYISGDYAAIKKVNGDVSKEIELLNKVNHFNLIRLSGVCFSGGHWYLVYEYAANGALSDWIYYSNNEGNFLSWTQRVQIALDVATGLNYLHSFTSPPHIHKDIKSSNVLIDSDFRAKIANLAMARSTEGQDGEFALTRHIVGTKGYMAPEYLENGLVSTKLDVYAFGILMLEMVTGKEVAALYTEENLNLSDILNDVLSKEDGQQSLKQFVDPSMEENFPSEISLFMMVRMIDSCLNKNPADRPAMDEISQSLSRILTDSLSWESSNASGYQRFSRNF